MAMTAAEIEDLIRADLPDAEITVEDLAGDGNHYRARVVSRRFAARRGCSSTRWSTRPSAAAWAAPCMRSP